MSGVQDSDDAIGLEEVDRTAINEGKRTIVQMINCCFCRIIQRMRAHQDIHRDQLKDIREKALAQS
jgi:hypothetical protein